MLDQLESKQPRPNGKDASLSPRLGDGLGNTNPVGTENATLGWSGPADIEHIHVESSYPSSFLENIQGTFEKRSLEGLPDIVVQSPRGFVILEVKAPDQLSKPRAAGQVILFRKVMDDWGFNELEAATVLGFETASDIQDIFDGRKPVGHRDANDRLRAVLRIAADLDALYQDDAVIRSWLNEPQKDLGAATPRALMLEGSMENLLRVKYYAAHLSGR